MKAPHVVLNILVPLLSAAAGIAKVSGVPEEVAFLSGLGLNSAMILLFGLVQLLGAVLAIIFLTKMYGLILIFIGFLISAILVFSDGNLSFGVISIIPVLLSGYLIYRCATLHVTNQSSDAS